MKSQTQEQQKEKNKKDPELENYSRTWTDANVAGAQCSRVAMAQKEASEEDRNLWTRGSVCPWVIE